MSRGKHPLPIAVHNLPFEEVDVDTSSQDSDSHQVPARSAWGMEEARHFHTSPRSVAVTKEQIASGNHTPLCKLYPSGMNRNGDPIDYHRKEDNLLSTFSVQKELQNVVEDLHVIQDRRRRRELLHRRWHLEEYGRLLSERMKSWDKYQSAWKHFLDERRVQRNELAKYDGTVDEMEMDQLRFDEEYRRFKKRMEEMEISPSKSTKERIGELDVDKLDISPPSTSSDEQKLRDELEQFKKRRGVMTLAESAATWVDVSGTKEDWDGIPVKSRYDVDEEFSPTNKLLYTSGAFTLEPPVDGMDLTLETEIKNYFDTVPPVDIPPDVEDDYVVLSPDHPVVHEDVFATEGTASIGSGGVSAFRSHVRQVLGASGPYRCLRNCTLPKIDKEKRATKYLEWGNVIGVGASGEVFKGNVVWPDRNNQEVAIKVFRGGVSADGLEKLLGVELYVWNHLNHENLVKYLDYGFENVNKQFFIVMELARYGSLADGVEIIGPLKERCVAAITLQVSSVLPLVMLSCIEEEQCIYGLQHLHKNKIIHRDVKPGNLLVSRNGTVKICDFGACTQVMSFKSTLQSRHVFGTAHYCSPEVMLSENFSYSCDVWSLACSIIELLTGNPPYHECKGMLVFLKVADEKYDPLSMHSSLRRSASPSCFDFLERCMQRNWRNRPTIKELLQHEFLRSTRVLSSREVRKIIKKDVIRPLKQRR